MTASILPFIHAAGSWGEIGHQVGTMFAPAIERHLEAWIGHVVQETGCSRDAVEAAAAPFAEPIRVHAPFLWEELEGMSRGAGVPVSRLLILQARAEVMRTNKPRTLECTTFAVGGQRTTNGAVLFGQNVDLVPFLTDFGAIIRQQPKDAPATLSYTTAGLLGHNGMNEAGVGVCANFIDDPGGWGDGLPRYLLSRLALREESAERALEAVLRPPRAASRNLLIADDRGVFLDAELLRKEHAVIRGQDDVLVHANHLEAPEFRGYETASENSTCRRKRLGGFLDETRTPLTLDDLQRFYRDHTDAPHSLCAHPFAGRNIQTVVSIIGDLTNRELHAAKGSPCRAPYATYTLATCRTGALSVTVRDRYEPATERA